ncbi:MAG: hypothetical protein IMF09_07390 [Proteobacteria bacterium]|nr:hypothetical protein [Pseudomonadota bacterium]
MKELFIFSLMALSLVACGKQDQAVATTETETQDQATTVVAEVAETRDFSSLIQQAEDLYAQTKAANHAWSVNLDRLKEARQSASEGDMDNAVANAEEAIKLAELALIQAEAEKTLWQDRVPK